MLLPDSSIRSFEITRSGLAELRSGSERRDDPVPRRDEVGLHDEVAVRGAEAAVGRREVVGAAGGVEVVHGADGDDVRIVAGRVDREVTVAAAVAGGGDDDDATAARLDRVRERIGARPAGVAEGGSESGCHRRSVSDRPSTASMTLLVPLTVRVEHPQRNEI
jgi:hypothetical protein